MDNALRTWPGIHVVGYTYWYKQGLHSTINRIVEYLSVNNCMLFTMAVLTDLNFNTYQTQQLYERELLNQEIEAE